VSDQNGVGAGLTPPYSKARLLCLLTENRKPKTENGI